MANVGGHKPSPVIWFSSGLAKIIAPNGIVDKDGNPIEGTRFATFSTESITAGGEITTVTTQGFQMRRIQGSGGAVTASSTPFGTTGGWPDGTLIHLFGQDATNTVTLTHNDAAKGAILNGNATLGSYDQLSLQYDQDADRWVEVGRNF